MSSRKDHPVPKVGDTVALNDYGLHHIFGRTLGLSRMRSLRFRVTWVANEPMTEPEPTYLIQVDDPELNRLLIHHRDFDIVASS